MARSVANGRQPSFQGVKLSQKLRSGSRKLELENRWHYFLAGGASFGSPKQYLATSSQSDSGNSLCSSVHSAGL